MMISRCVFISVSVLVLEVVALAQHTPNANEPGIVELPVGNASLGTEVVLELVPVSVDAPPGVGGLPEAVISLSGNDLVLSEGDHNVWLEYRIGNWDPDNVDLQLGAWQLKLDASSLASGDQGELTAYTAGGAGTCASDADCEELLGSAVQCDPPGYYKTAQFGAGYCSYLSIDQARGDFVYNTDFGTVCGIVVKDVSVLDVRPAATTCLRGPDDPEPFPGGGLYAGTLTLHVPADARGTFSVDLLPFPESQLIDQGSQFIQPLVVRSATITVQTGRCCFDLEHLATGGAGCLDDLQTVGTCAQMPGLTVFDANASCNDPCPPTCGDGVLNGDEECDDGLAGNSDTEPNTCRSDCTLPTCGDGIIDTSFGEECDSDGSGCPTGQCLADCTCDTNVPTVSQWGMTILCLVLLTGAKRYFGRRSTQMRDARA